MLSKKAEEYLRRQRELGYEPSLNGMDEEDFDYVPSWVQNQQPEQPLAREFQPVDRDFAERMFKMFARPFDQSWQMPNMDGPEYRQRAVPAKPYEASADATGDGVQPMSASVGGGQEGAGKWRDTGMQIDPIGMFPQYDTGVGTESSAKGNGTYDRYRNNEIVPGAGQSAQENTSGKLTPSDKVINFIGNYEEFRDKPYKVDGRGNWTIGFGHEILPGEDFSSGINEPEARKLLAKQVNEHAAAVNQWAEANNLTLSQQQFDALVSLRYNLGSLDGVPKLRSHIISGNATPEQIRAQFENTISDGAKNQPGLWQRRRDEADMYFTGDYRRKELPLPKELFPDI